MQGDADFSELHFPKVPVRVRSTTQFAERRMSALVSIFFPKADEGTCTVRGAAKLDEVTADIGKVVKGVDLKIQA